MRASSCRRRGCKNPKIPKAISDIVMKAMAPDITPAISARPTCSTTCWRRADAGAARRAARRPRAADAAAPRDEAQDIQARLRARETPAAAVLLAVPQAAPRPHRSLPVLRRSAVDPVTPNWIAKSAIGAAMLRSISVESSSWLSRDRQNLDERQAGGLEGRQDPHRLARHPLRQRRVRRRALLRRRRAAPACFRLDAHMRRLLRLRQDLPDGAARSRRPADRGRPRHHPRQRVQGVLHPADRLSRLRHARRQPAPLPGRRRDHRRGNGAPTSAQDALEKGVDVRSARGRARRRTRSRRSRRARRTTRTRS